jgi:hypothetical protein
MATSTFHPDMELRIEQLTRRLVTLRKMAARKPDSERLSDLSDIERLEHRHALLVEQLRGLDAEGPGRWQNAKAGLARLVDDVFAAIEDAVLRLDHEAGREQGRQLTTATRSLHSVGMKASEQTEAYW